MMNGKRGRTNQFSDAVNELILLRNFGMHVERHVMQITDDCVHSIQVLFHFVLTFIMQNSKELLLGTGC